MANKQLKCIHVINFSLLFLVVILDKIGMRTATGLLDACANERSYHSNQFGSY